MKTRVLSDTLVENPKYIDSNVFVNDTKKSMNFGCFVCISGWNSFKCFFALNRNTTIIFCI